MKRFYIVWVGGIEDICTTSLFEAKSVFYENLADGYLDAKLVDCDGNVILEWL